MRKKPASRLWQISAGDERLDEDQWRTAVSGNQGYLTLNAPNQPLLSPYYHGAELPGGDRGATLRQAQTPAPTAGVQASNALSAGGVAGWGLTLPKASPPLVLAFTNVDSTASMNIWPLPGVLPNMPAADPLAHFADTINGSTAPFVLAPGASVTLTAEARGQWSSS